MTPRGTTRCLCGWYDVTTADRPPGSEWIKGPDDPDCSVHRAKVSRPDDPRPALRRRYAVGSWLLRRDP